MRRAVGGCGGQPEVLAVGEADGQRQGLAHWIGDGEGVAGGTPGGGGYLWQPGGDSRHALELELVPELARLLVQERD
eukprot:scaffold11049_cov96-Isochrysis_galbana.AAC.2